jgi:hypothetical protein
LASAALIVYRRIIDSVYASALTADQERELRALRARAYGPDADIGSDPEALSRLRELEAREHPVTVPARTPEPPEPSSDTTVPVLGADADEQFVPAGTPELTWTSRVRTRLRALPPLAWIVIAATVVIVAAGVWTVSQVTASGADFTLAPIDSEAAPPPLVADNYFTTLYGASRDGMRAHESYRTITPWSWSSADGTRCLLLTVEGFDRPVGGSCTPAGIDPSHDVTIWPGLSQELIGDLPQGSVIRFELHDGRVHVWVRAANERS